MIDDKRYPGNILVLENRFFERLKSLSEQVLSYDDSIYQALARSVIPTEKLESDAAKTLGFNRSSIPKQGTLHDQFLDQVLLNLLRWFKCDFFHWIDAPKCDRCGANTRTSDASLPPTREELRFGGSRVEGYQCEVCQCSVRFPRYNDPGKLLETRCGRCGEWANCFTLCAKAVGFDARFIMDWTDHVWTEVWSESKQRWLHCDPCENVCDKPLLYERGWKKKLSYVIAFSANQIVDVTWRYTANFRETLQRRTECRESRLVDFVFDFNQKKMQLLTQEERSRMLNRTVSELAELMSAKKTLREGEEEGRSSGSLHWRLERGEAAGTTESVRKQNVLQPQEEEFQARLFRLRYNCAKDEYERPILKEIIPDWRSCVYSGETVFRKEEFDWKNVYLARKEGCDSGEVSWKIDVKHDKLRVSAVSVNLDFTTFENGIVRGICCFGGHCVMLQKGFNQISEGLEKVEEVTVTLTLEGGRGDCAWQHAQLFRTSFGSATNSFELNISFEQV